MQDREVQKRTLHGAACHDVNIWNESESNYQITNSSKKLRRIRKGERDASGKIGLGD